MTFVAHISILISEKNNQEDEIIEANTLVLDLPVEVAFLVYPDNVDANNSVAGLLEIIQDVNMNEFASDPEYEASISAEGEQ